MKVVILAGGLGTRISEETVDKPKPMVLIKNRPILEHLIETFSRQGLNDFIIAVGYKRQIIESWAKGITSEFQNISTVDTGLETQTGGRIKRIMQKYPGERILVTYGDGLANINISSLLKFHQAHGGLATVTAVHPPARFGYLHMDGGAVTHFGEKNQSDAGWINGGYFVLEPTVVKYIDGDEEPFETGALPRLVKESELFAYRHEGFWQPMDTLREKHDLELLAELEIPPWLNLTCSD